MRADDDDAPDPGDLIGSDVIEPTLAGGTLVWESGDVKYRWDSPYLIVNTKFWEMEPVFPKEPVTVFRTVHVGDVVKAWEADSPDPDDFIGSDKVGRGRGTLIFEGDDARYLASYQPGAC